MRSILILLLVGSLIAIGTVLLGGVGDLYELGNIVVLPGSKVLIAGFAVLGGAAAGLFSWGEVEVIGERGIKTRFAYRPGLIATAVILFATAGFVVFADSSSGNSPSGLSNPDSGWSVGACADVIGDEVRLTSCSGSSDALIVAIPSSELSCPLETDFYVELTAGVACLVES